MNNLDKKPATFYEKRFNFFDYAKKGINFSEEIKLVIDYSKNVDQLIVEGNYNEVDGINNEFFPIPSQMLGKKVVVCAKFFHFDYKINSWSVIDEMDENGYRPATVIELLSFLLLNQKFQEESLTIVALGSILDLYSDAQCFSWTQCFDLDNSIRKMGLGFLIPRWWEGTKFLGIKL
jgi:hypothetical protein